MKILGILALTIAMGLTMGATAQEECDWASLWADALAGDFEWIPDDFDQATIDAAIDNIDVFVWDGETPFDIDLPSFGDTVQLVKEGCTFNDDTSQANWYVVYDASEPATWSFPDDFNNAEFSGGGNGFDGAGWGMFSVMTDEIYIFAVMAGSGTPEPNLSLGVEGNTYDEEGGDINLSANGTMMAPYQWTKDGGDMAGETNATFSILGAVVADSGSYGLDFSDGESNAVAISIFAAGSLPVSGLIGLGLLAAVSALGGLVALRKKQ